LKKFLAPLILGLFWALTLGQAVASMVATADEMPSSAPLFAATLNDLDDKPVALERYRGKPLIVNFWARWCGPCRVEIPELIAIRKAHKGKLEVLGIGIEDKADAAKEFAKAYEMDYPVFVAREKGIPLMQALGNTKGGLPFTIVIDRNGQVVQKKMGIMKKADLDAAAELALKGR
jgi:thiol-disulfide isomerase/thioredoxin